MNTNLKAFVDSCAEIARPEKVEWITGEKGQLDRLTEIALGSGELIKLNEELLPGCYLHRSALNDVARVEGRTFICCKKRRTPDLPTTGWNLRLPIRNSRRSSRAR